MFFLFPVFDLSVHFTTWTTVWMCHNGQKKNSILIQFRDFCSQRRYLSDSVSEKKIKTEQDKTISYWRQPLAVWTLTCKSNHVSPGAVSDCCEGGGGMAGGALHFSMHICAERPPFSTPTERTKGSSWTGHWHTHIVHVTKMHPWVL